MPQNSETPPASAAWRFNLNLMNRRRMVTDTIGFSRVEFQFQPSGLSFLSELDPKLKLDAAEAGGIQKRVRDSVRLKLKNHSAEASGIPRFFAQVSVVSSERTHTLKPHSLSTPALSQKGEGAGVMC